MMKTYGFFLPIVCLLVVSCSPRRENVGENRIITVDVAAVKEIRLPAENVQRIVLDDDADGVLGSVKKMYIRDSIIYIHHRQKMSMFDLGGTFRGNISNLGRAGNEYLTMWYSWTEGSGLYMYDLNGKKIMRYDFADKSLTDTALPEDTKAFQAVMPLAGRGFVGKSGFMGGRNDDNPELGFYDSGYGFVSGIGSLELNSGLWLGYPFSAFEDEVLYWRQLDNEIFSIKENLDFGVKYTLDFVGHNVPEMDFEDDYAKIDFINKSPEKYVAGLFDVEETEDCLSFVFIYRETKNIARYSKSDGSMDIYRFTFDGPETLNTVIPYGDKIIVVADTDGGNSVVYLVGN